MMVSASGVGRQGTATNALGTFSNVGTLATWKNARRPWLVLDLPGE
jgi:hypothetical protein